MRREEGGDLGRDGVATRVGYDRSPGSRLAIAASWSGSAVFCLRVPCSSLRWDITWRRSLQPERFRRVETRDPLGRAAPRA